MRAVVCLSLIVLISACSRPTLAEITREQCDLIEDFTNVIDGVSSEEDARGAVGKIEKLTARAKRLKRRYHEVSIPTKEELVAVKAELGGRVEEVYGRFFTSDADSGWSPEVREILKNSLAEFVNTMFEERE